MDTQDFIELSNRDDVENIIPDSSGEQLSKKEMNQSSKDAALGATLSNLQKMQALHASSSCPSNESESSPEYYTNLMQQYRKLPRVIMKNPTKKNRVLLVRTDGSSQDITTLECNIHNSMKVDGMSIQKAVD